MRITWFTFYRNCFPYALTITKVNLPFPHTQILSKASLSFEMLLLTAQYSLALAFVTPLIPEV